MRTRILVQLLMAAALIAISVYAHEALSYQNKQPSKKEISKLITKYAKQYNLDRTYLSCLFKIESEYNLKAISKSGDYGIGQINQRTAASLNIDIEKLTKDLDYSIERSTSMLAYYKWLKHDEEPRTWVCRYNVGPGPLTKRGRSANCETYLERFYKCTTGTLVGVL